MRTTAKAWRRNLNGSLSPEGFCPIAKIPTKVSRRSASDKARPNLELGSYRQQTVACTAHLKQLLHSQIHGHDGHNNSPSILVSQETPPPYQSLDHICLTLRRDVHAVYLN